MCDGCEPPEAHAWTASMESDAHTAAYEQKMKMRVSVRSTDQSKGTEER